MAQVGSAALGGTVQDSSGALIPGASVTAVNAGTGQTRVTRTNGSGVFSFAAVLSGDYNLTVQSPGFGTLTRSAIHLNPGDNLNLSDLRLAVGATVAVEVQSDTATLPLDSGQLSATITAADLDRLSVSGRDATELQRILPGFAIRSLGNTNTAPDFSQVQIGQPTPYASNGAPVAGITLKLDGANLTDAGSLGANLQNINDSFVSEVQVQTSNFGADQSNGPVLISGVTKSGTKKYHGSLYTYARVAQLNSNDSLAKYDGFTRPDDRFVFPGATISGHVPRSNKLTFFAGAEFDAQKNVYAYNGGAAGAIVQALVPTQALRNGDFSAAALQSYLGPKYNDPSYPHISPTPTVGDDNSALVNGNISRFIDPNARRLINAVLPLPNLPLINGSQTNSNGFNYQTENLVDNNIFQATGRLDYAANPSNLFFIRYSFEKGNQGEPQIPYYSPQAGSILGSVNTPGGGLLSKINVHSGSANYVHTFGATLTNEFFATVTYFRQNFVPKTPAALLSSTYGYTYNGIFDNGSTSLPQLQTYAEYGGLPLYLAPDFSLGPLFLKKSQPNGGDNLTKVIGPNTIKAGFFIQRIVNNQSITNGTSNGAIRNYYFGGAGSQIHSYAGKYADGTPAYDPTPHFASGNTLANFLEGQIQDFHQDSILPVTDLYFWNVDGYAQDAWRVTSNVVLTAGIRLTHLGAWTDSAGRGPAIFTPATIASSINQVTNPFPGFSWHSLNSQYSTSGTGSHALWAEPRVGFAWDLFRTGKTVLRGGVGVYRFHDAETDVDGAFQTSSGLKTGDLQGFGGNTLAGTSTVHQNPATYGGSGGTQTQLPIATVVALNQNENSVPVTNNYSLSIAQELPRHSILQLSYVGNNSNSLLNNGTTQQVVLNNVNAIPVGTLFTAAAAAAINKNAGYNACNPTGCTPVQAQQLDILQNYPGDKSVQSARPYPQYGNIIVPSHNTYANYNAVQVVYVKQTGRLTYNLNYTFSKALGILGGAADFNFTAPVDPFNIQNNYGPENFDRTQVFNSSYSYQFGKLVKNRMLGELANNWLVSGITTVESGGNLQTGVSFSPSFYLQGTIGNYSNGNTPLNVSNLAILGTPDVNLQPTVKCNPGSSLQKNQYINGACLGVPAVGTNGRLILPYLHGPKFFNTDLTLEKGFSLGGERNLRFRYAAFNFLNHPLHTFGSGYASQGTLNLSDASNNATTASAVYSPGSGFGFAPLTTGRRLSEISLKFDF